MKTLVKIAFLSAAALTIAGIAHADHRDYRIAPQIKEKTYNVSASDVNTQSGRDYRIAIVNSGHARN